MKAIVEGLWEAIDFMAIDTLKNHSIILGDGGGFAAIPCNFLQAAVWSSHSRQPSSGSMFSHLPLIVFFWGVTRIWL